MHKTNRKDQLERVNAQLRDLYGPLYALSVASEQTWTEFFKIYSPNPTGYWPVSNQRQAERWRLWMKEVFMPLNLQMEALVLKHSDLLVDQEMPKVLLDLSAHIEGYKAIMKEWDSKEQESLMQKEANLSIINYPLGLSEYASKHYLELKRKQSELLGALEDQSFVGSFSSHDSRN